MPTKLYADGSRSMHPLATPRAYVDYFHDLVVSADPPSSAWAIGEAAARVWMAYDEQADYQTVLRIDRIHLRMPYRFAGSGLRARWQTVVHALRNLSVQHQVPVWRAIFNPDHHGDHPISHVARAEAMLHQWSTIAHECPSQEVARTSMMELVSTFGPDMPLVDAWIALAYGIQAWFTPYAALPSFVVLIIAQHHAASKH